MTQVSRRGWGADDSVPVFDGHMAGDEGGAVAVAIIEPFEQTEV